MLDPWVFLVVSLAAFRITRFVVFDSLIGGNLDSQSKFSRWLDVFAYDSEGNNRTLIRGKIGDLLTCPYCVGAWVSLGVVAVWFYGSDPVRWGVTVWAVAGLQALLSKLDRR